MRLSQELQGHSRIPPHLPAPRGQCWSRALRWTSELGDTEQPDPNTSQGGALGSLRGSLLPGQGLGQWGQNPLRS